MREQKKIEEKQPKAPADAQKFGFGPGIFYFRQEKKLNKQMIDLFGT
jgi:hypothetical protein